MVFGVIKRHGGTLEIDSTPGAGTTFRISLPPGEAPSTPKKPSVPRSAAPCGSWSSMTNPSPEHVVAKYLEMDGHEVVTAVNGREGMSKFMDDRFDLLLTDHAMPEMNGVELAGAVKAIDEFTPVILLTGFDAAATRTSENPPGVDVILHKPIPHNKLRRAIRDAVAPSAERLLPAAGRRTGDHPRRR